MKRVVPRFGNWVAVGVAGVVLTVLAGVSSASRTAAPPPPAGAALDALAQPPTRTSIASQRIYFVMTDRYRNGDPSNDRGGLSGGSDTTGFDPQNTGYFHGGDFKGLTGDCTGTKAGLARVKALGFTALWVTPPVGQKAVQGDSAAYHGYWGLRFDQVDRHLGSDADFGAFVACAHRLGLKVFMDIVVNHTADVIQLGDTSYSAKAYRNCKGKRFNPAKYVTRKFPCMKASNMPHVPAIPPAERNAKSPAWMNDVTKYHNRGDIDFSGCSPMCLEQGDFAGLDDLFTEQTAVWQGLADVYAGWIRRYKLDGFRIDTAKHVNAAFFHLWVPRILAAARAAGVSDFQMFAEVTLTDDVELSKYVRDRGLPNVLDFPFQDVAAGYVAGNTSAQAIANRLADDDYFRVASDVAPTPVTFLGNHDMGRAAFQIAQHGASTDTLLPRTLLGYDVMYLLRGAPTVYYGDEVGMIGSGGDKAAREDMFPTQVDEWKTEPRLGSPPIGNGSSFDVTNNPIELRLEQLAALKDDHPALSTGATVVRRAAGAGLVVSRIDWAARREYVEAFNAGASPLHVSVQTGTPSSSWSVLLGPSGTRSTNAGGMLALDVPAFGAIVLEASSQLPAAAPPKPALKVGHDPFSSLWRAGATVGGTAPVSVSFAIKRKKSAPWQLLAADDSPPFQAFLERGQFAKKQRVYLVAIARSASGETAVSKVIGFVPRPR